MAEVEVESLRRRAEARRGSVVLARAGVCRCVLVPWTVVLGCCRAVVLLWWCYCGVVVLCYLRDVVVLLVLPVLCGAVVLCSAFVWRCAAAVLRCMCDAVDAVHLSCFLHV